MRRLGTLPGFAPLLLAVALGLAATGARADDPVAAFYGTYSGSAVAKDRDSRLFGVTRRDLDVSILREADGRFRVRWTTVTPRRDGKSDRSTTDILFRPAGGKRVWAAEAATDPMGPNGYAWARIDGRALIVHVLSVDGAGRHNIATYRRERVDGGLRLEFRRQRDGEPVRIVTGTLARRE